MLVQSLNQLESELSSIEELLLNNEDDENLIAAYNTTRLTQEVVRERIIINRLLEK
jgi:hypothetical protein